MLSNRYHCR